MKPPAHMQLSHMCMACPTHVPVYSNSQAMIPSKFCFPSLLVLITAVKWLPVTPQSYLCRPDLSRVDCGKCRCIGYQRWLTPWTLGSSNMVQCEHKGCCFAGDGQKPECYHRYTFAVPPNPQCLMNSSLIPCGKDIARLWVQVNQSHWPQTIISQGGGIQGFAPTPNVMHA